MDYLYLHGFASSPQSGKAQLLQSRFAEQGQVLHLFDLNQPDFRHLTLSRQIQQGVDWIRDRDRVTIIGSSLGGLTATWIAQQSVVQPQISQLVLLAPAFQFLAQWLPRLGSATVEHWRSAGELAVYHYGQQQPLPLAYTFISDAQSYDETQLQAPIPTLILHGRQDEVIDIQVSRDYAIARPWVDLVELEADHSLATVYEELWSAIAHCLQFA